MSISRRRFDLGSGTALAIAALAAMAVSLAVAGGCGEKSLPAATASVASSTTKPKIEVASLEGSSKAMPGSPAARDSAKPVPARRLPLRDITFDTVKLNMQKGDPFRPELLTSAVKKLDGNRIRIRGFILPPPQQTGLTKFVLVRDNMACCFGPGAAIYDSMIVQLKQPLTMDYTVLPVTVEGTFNIHQVNIGDRTLSIYHVTADKAQ
ncbi:MAG TPA: DUF3299 domain-containing protein [Pirellulales bacterium]|jgi:hypothetical protein|nr:DUF3299 domain-containing protein [Pirellulales bacterium]